MVTNSLGQANLQLFILSFSQSLLLLTDEDMPFYEILISELQPSDELLASVAKLPLEYDAAAYALFVETYGTHFVEQVRDAFQSKVAQFHAYMKEGWMDNGWIDSWMDG